MFNLTDIFDSLFSNVARPNKNVDTVVITFDTLEKNIVFYRVSKLDFANPENTAVPYTGSFLSETFLSEFELACSEYFSKLQDVKYVCYFVMPDNMVMMDHMVLPAMKADKQQLALKTQIDTLFKNKNLIFHNYVAVQNKQYSHYHLTIVNKSSLEALYKCTATSKVNLKGTSFFSNCLLNGLLHYKAGLRKKSFVFLNLKEDHTDIVVCVKGKTAGYTTLMLGTEHLLDNEVLQENTLYDHDVADLAIINAKENAKRKQLTVSEDEDEDILLEMDGEQEISDAEAIRAVVDEAEKQMNDKALQNAAEDLGISAEQKAINDQLDAEEAEEAELERMEQEAIANMSPARKKKIFARKAPKRLPKFMLREEPTTPEGFVYENFRMFVKWALLYNKQLKDSDYLPEMDCILVNMPEQYKFVVDMVNQTEDVAVPFEYAGEFDSAVSENLDKIGAIYMSAYNKRENF